MPRPSPVRDAIADAVASSHRHDWSIEDLVMTLDDTGVRADFSSVFRALARLEDEGVVRRVELGDGKQRFEAAGDHHEHVRCERCGVVGEVPGCAVRSVVPGVQEATGFVVTGHQLLFSGVCPACVRGEG